MKRQIHRCLLLFLAACLSVAGRQAVSGALPQAAYVWQRDWGQSVRDSVSDHARAFQSLVALKAEVIWHCAEPSVVQVSVDYPSLKAAHEPLGLALRIGPYPGPFAMNDPAARFLIQLTSTMIAQARSADVEPSEVQIDFDCASTKLEGYRVWVEAIRHLIAPVPLTITALPAWLDQPAFGKLIAATDGYVLQVHSLAAPKNATAQFTLCDPAAAQRAVARAGTYGVPFRVALPTYGYVLAFDRTGKFFGLSADGPAPGWPSDVQQREIRTDPFAIAQLVRLWTAQHPTAMQGIIWYRLPVAEDNLNLRWPTLAALMAGCAPRAHWRVDVRRTEPELFELTLVNDGELDLSPLPPISLRWQDARLVAGDGLGGFDLAEDGPTSAHFQTIRQNARLPAGDKQALGWLRLSVDREVQIETTKN